MRPTETKNSQTDTGTPAEGERSGRIRFSRETERRVFFYLTLGMLLLGLLVKAGWL